MSQLRLRHPGCPQADAPGHLLRLRRLRVEDRSEQQAQPRPHDLAGASIPSRGDVRGHKASQLRCEGNGERMTGRHRRQYSFARTGVKRHTQEQGVRNCQRFLLICKSAVGLDAEQRCNTLDIHISPGPGICAD